MAADLNPRTEEAAITPDTLADSHPSQQPERVHEPPSNQLLASLPEADRSRWQQALEPVDLVLGQVLSEPHGPVTHAYFPTSAIVSLLYVTENGGSAEIAVVGHEGMIGIPLFMGGGSAPSRAVVQSAGHGFRVRGSFLLEETRRSPALMNVLLRFTQALISQMAQTAVCNRHHAVDSQLCRWLLSSLDRRPGHDMVVTQELIANMLGVRREGVTQAALALQQAGLIRYRRGHLSVLDRAGLQRRSCECYAVVKAEYDRLLPLPSPRDTNGK